MQAIKFFHRELPVIGDPKIVDFDDGPHKVWSLILRLPTGDIPVEMREKIGVVSLQERFDYYLWHEAGLSACGRLMCYASHFEPATKEDLGDWMQAHHKRKVH